MALGERIYGFNVFAFIEEKIHAATEGCNGDPVVLHQSYGEICREIVALDCSGCVDPEGTEKLLKLVTTLDTIVHPVD